MNTQFLAADAPQSTFWKVIDLLAVENPAGVLAVLLGVLAIIFWATQSKAFAGIFKVVPALVFCYFVPTTLTTLGILPAESALYSWVKGFVLPASLMLLILALDVPGIIRLGPKAIIMLLAGTTGVVIGGPVALLICTYLLPESLSLPDDIWQGMTALSGSWIGGGANFVALGDMAGASSSMMAMMVVPDVLVASIWMGVLLYLAGRQHEIDRWTGADARAIRDLETRLTEFQQRVNRIATLPDLMMIVGLAFVASWASYAGGKALFGVTYGSVAGVAETTLAQPDMVEQMPVKGLVRAIDTAFGENADLAAKAAPEVLGRYNACRMAGSIPWTSIGDLPFETFPEVVHGTARAVLVEGGGIRELSVYEIGLLTDAAGNARSDALAHLSGGRMFNYRVARFLSGSIGAGTWKYILVTTIGVILSFTRMRNLEGAGASKLGSVMLYLLVACIGASANFREVFEYKGVFVMGFIWMMMHVIFMLGVGYLIKAPIFFVAVGSQSNIGGAASAPVVAAAYHPSLAPVGALLAVLGYVLGTYAGLLCMSMLRSVAGAG